MDKLLDALTRMYQSDENDTHGYHFKRADEGYSGVVYQVIDRDSRKFAVKIARRNERRRAWREFSVTQALHTANITDVCPKPLHLFEAVDTVNGDVIVSEWLAGKPLNVAPPADDRDTWHAILHTLTKIHSFTHDKTGHELLMAIAPVRNPDDLLAIIRTRFERLPQKQMGLLLYEQVKQLVDTLHEQVPHQWDTEPPLTLIHCDSHPANMLLHDGQIRFVDWENSGWADPAFDISNMTTFWRYADLPQSHFDWLHQTYIDMTNDKTLAQRVQVYATIQCVHWVVNYCTFILRRGETRDDKVHRFSADFELKWQKHYWEKARASLHLD